MFFPIGNIKSDSVAKRETSLSTDGSDASGEALEAALNLKGIEEAARNSELYISIGDRSYLWDWSNSSWLRDLNDMDIEEDSD